MLPTAFIQPLILMTKSSFFKYCGYSVLITRSNSSAIPVLLAIPKLQVSVPGHAVISTALL